jgi:translation initiation factor IF-1
MPKNLFGGNKAKKGKNRGPPRRERKDLPLPDATKDSHIAHVVKVLGDRRFDVEILTNKTKSKTVQCRIPTRLKKSGRVVVGTHVLINSSVDNIEIDYVYSEEDVIHLINTDEIIDINMGGEDGGGNVTGFEWGMGSGEAEIELGDDVDVTNI